VNAQEILAQLLRANVQCWFEGEKLCYRAPRGTFDDSPEPRDKGLQPLALTPGLRELAVAHKAALRAFMGEGVKYSRASFSQESAWLLEQSNPGQPILTLPTFSFEIFGPLDRQAFEAAWDDVVQRHEPLRTHFRVVDGLLAQVIQPALHVPFDLDWIPAFAGMTQRTPASPMQIDAIRETAEAAVRVPFDLTQGPLLRAHVFSLGPDQHVLVAPMHHLIRDGWSMGVLLHDLLTAYEARSKGAAPSWPPLPTTYAQHTQAQRLVENESAITHLLNYWRETLADAPATVKLPTNLSASRSYRAAEATAGECVFTLPKTLTQRLRTLSHREGVSMFMILFAAFQALLYRYSGQERFAVGVGTANRTPQPHDLKNLVGFFVNMLVMRADVAGQPTFRDLLARVRETALGAYEHNMPFERLVKALNPARDPGAMPRWTRGCNPLFNVSFVLHNMPRPTAVNGSLKLRRYRVHTGTAQFDLSMAIEERPEGLEGVIEYRTAIFDSDAAERMIRHFRVLLESAVANPDTPVDRLPLLDEAERDCVLRQWAVNGQGVATPCPDEPPLDARVEVYARTTPDAPAVMDGPRTVTYEDLNRRADALANGLRARGVGPEQIAAVLLDRSAEQIIAMLAIYKTGAAYLPLDPGWPSARINTVIQDANPAILITRQPFTPIALKTSAPVLTLEENTHDGPQRPQCPQQSPGDNDLAYIIYTSGTTGVPKGVAIERRSLHNLVAWHRDTYALTPQDRGSVIAGVAFDASIWEIWPYLASGACLCVEPGEARVTPEALRDWLVERRITVAFVPTPLLDELLKASWPEACSLRTVLTGGDRLLKYPPPNLPFVLVNHYGPTENTVISTAAAIPPLAGGQGVATPCPLTLPPIGRPIANTRAYVLDAQKQPVPIGVPGELYLGGVGLARGYLGRDKLTEQCFVNVPNPFNGDGNERLYKTGDRVRWRNDGQLEFLGRLDRQVKVRGFRIELQEIESVIALHPDVSGVVVLAHCGLEGEMTLAAYLVPNNPASFELNRVIKYLRGRIPAYMIPVQAAVLDAFPLTHNGKVDHAALADMPVQPVAAAVPYRAPETPLEIQLTSMVQELVRNPRVGVDDNFFEIGGHSLLAMRWIARIQEQFGVEWPVRAFFDAPSVAGAARWIERHAKTASIDVASLSDTEVDALLAQLLNDQE